MDDPIDEGLEPEADPASEGGSPPPNQGGDPQDAGAALKRENQQLRARLREAEAKRLGQQFSLPEGVVDLLKTVPVNEMEAKAKAIAEGLPQSSGGGQPPAPEPEPMNEPPNKDKLAAMGDGEESGKPPAPPALDTRGDDSVLREIQGAQSWAEVEAKQNAMRAAAREQGQQ